MSFYYNYMTLFYAVNKSFFTTLCNIYKEIGQKTLRSREKMIPDVVKIEREGRHYLLFNRRGMVLELTACEYAIFKEHAAKRRFPKEHAEFFNRLCCYEMTSFEGYTPKPVRVEYTQKLLGHDSGEPLFAAPIVAHLGITGACNMRCSYCSVRKPYSGKGELSKDQWKTVISKLSEMGAFQIGFTGGEPTLHNDLVELAQHVTRCGCTFNLTTNCWNLDEALVRQLKEAGMRQCQVSLDSHVPQTNDELRMRGCFSRVLRAIRMLHRNGITVGIDCVLTSKNIGDIPGFVTWLSRMRVGYLTLIKVKQGDLDIRTFRSLLPGHEEYSRLLDLLCKRKNQNPCVTIDCGSVCNLEQVLRDGELTQVPIAGCPVGHTLLSIAPNGDIYPCVALSQEQFRIGNALSDDLRDVWQNSPALRQLREVKSRIKGKCSSCRRLDHCRGGCRGIALSLTKDLWISDPTCGGEPHGSES